MRSGSSGATYLTSLSVTSGEGLSQRTDVPLSATSRGKLRSVAHPQQIYPPPQGAGGTDETSTKATIPVTRHITGSLYGGGAVAVKDSQPTPVSITDTVPEPWLVM